MKRLAKLGYLAAACAVLVTTFAMIGPRAVRATVAALVRDVDNPGRATIVVPACNASSTSGSAGDFACRPSFTVPLNQRLVIEQVEGDCITPSGKTVVQASVSLSEAGVDSEHILVLTPEALNPFGFDPFVVNQSVRYYADPGSTFQFNAFTTDGSGSTICSWQLNGYLISFP